MISDRRHQHPAAADAAILPRAHVRLAPLCRGEVLLVDAVEQLDAVGGIEARLGHDVEVEQPVARDDGAPG